MQDWGPVPHLCSHDTQTAVATAINNPHPATAKVNTGNVSDRGLGPFDARGVDDVSFARPIAASARCMYELVCPQLNEMTARVRHRLK